MKKFKLTEIFSQTAIADKIKAYANQVNQKYHNQKLIIIIVLRGALYFGADLTKQLSTDLNLQIYFISYQSYLGNQKVAINNHLQSQLKHFENQNLSQSHILILDDIWDTGKTLANLQEAFSVFQPASIKFAVLIKNASTTVNPIHTNNIDVLFTWNKTSNQNWLIGYGMDLDDYGRHFPAIYVVNAQ